MTDKDLRWRELFFKVAIAANCLPSSFVDANEHVIKAIEQRFGAVDKSESPLAYERGWSDALRYAKPEPTTLNALSEVDRQLKIANDCCERLMSACTDAGCPDGINMADWIRKNAILQAATREAPSADAVDALRYRWLRGTLHGAKAGGGVEVNEQLQVYETPDPGEEVRVYWYQNTPVGFYELKASTLDEAVDSAIAASVPKGST